MNQNNQLLFVIASPTGPYDPPGVLYSLATEISRESEVLFIPVSQKIKALTIKNIFQTLNNIFQAIISPKREILIWEFLSLIPQRFGDYKIYQLQSKFVLFIYLKARHIFQHKTILFYNYSPDGGLIERYIPYQYSIYDCLDVFSPDQFSKNVDRIKKYDLVFAHNELLFNILFDINKQTKLTSHGAYIKHNKYNLSKRIKNSVVFSGGISNRIDFDLLKKVITKLKSINFYFVGKQYIMKHYVSSKDRVSYLKWKRILSLPNVTFFSVGSDPESYALTSLFKVSILPYQTDDIPGEYANQNVTPMKILGYFANHLPIVSTPLKIMKYYESKGFPVYCADNSTDFSAHLLKAVRSRKNFDYDEKLINQFINNNLMPIKIKQIFKHINNLIQSG